MYQRAIPAMVVVWAVLFPVTLLPEAHAQYGGQYRAQRGTAQVAPRAAARVAPRTAARPTRDFAPRVTRDVDRGDFYYEVGPYDYPTAANPWEYFDPPFVIAPDARPRGLTTLYRPEIYKDDLVENYYGRDLGGLYYYDDDLLDYPYADAGVDVYQHLNTEPGDTLPWWEEFPPGEPLSGDRPYYDQDWYYNYYEAGL